MYKNFTNILGTTHILIHVDGGARDVEAHDLVKCNISSECITCILTMSVSSSAYRPGTRYNRVLRYSRISMCCPGYAGTPPNCPRKCSSM